MRDNLSNLSALFTINLLMLRTVPNQTFLLGKWQARFQTMNPFRNHRFLAERNEHRKHFDKRIRSTHKNWLFVEQIYIKKLYAICKIFDKAKTLSSMWHFANTVAQWLKCDPTALYLYTSWSSIFLCVILTVAFSVVLDIAVCGIANLTADNTANRCGMLNY